MYQVNYRERTIYKGQNEILLGKDGKEYPEFNELGYLTQSMFFEDEDSLDEIKEILAEDLKDAKKIAKEKFKGITDKAGKDYFEGHLTSVAKNTTTIQGEIVAYLHDIIEDTDVTYEELSEMFGNQIAFAVYRLTHKKDKDYFDYIKELKYNRLAVEVKLADLKNNMDLSRLDKITDKDKKRLEKYKKAYKILTENTWHNYPYSI